MRVSLVAGFFYFLIGGSAGVIFGVLREMFVTPVLGRSTAVFIELPFMLLICWFGCRLMVRLLKVPDKIWSRIAMGAVAFAGLIGMEQSLQLAMRLLSINGFTAVTWTLGDYFGLAGQIAYGLFPLFVSADTEPETEPNPASVLRKEQGRAPTSRQ
jgi:hypothetical protein